MAFVSTKWYLLIFVLEILIFTGGCHLVRNGEELEMCLCNKTLGEDVILVLNHSVNYEVSHNGFCIVNAIRSIIITSDSSHFATVTCTHENNNTTPHSTAGFAFINISVVLTRVVFHGCGATLPYTLHQRVNSSIFRFSNAHAATILFMQCAANINNINITYYYGFAFVAVNLQNSSFLQMSVNNNIGIKHSNTNSKEITVGSGVLMLFSDVDNNDQVIQDIDYSIITLFDCTFMANAEFIYNKAKLCIPGLYYSLKNAPFTVVNAAALTIIFNQKTFHPVVSIEQTQFRYNFGNLAAAVLILMFNTTEGHTEISGDSSFDHNINFYPCYGSALVFYMIHDSSLDEHSTSSRIQLLNIINTTIKDHNGIPNLFNGVYGAVYLGVASPVTAMEFYFKNVTFKKNFSIKSGACIFITVYGRPITEIGKVGVTLESITAYNNSQSDIEFSPSNTGMFTFNNIHQVTINGSSSQPSHFLYNYGSVIDALSSTIYLNGHVIFENNQAKSGAAIRFWESILYFNDSLNVTFYNNTAEQLGGAIFGMKSTFSANPECGLQIPISNNSIMNFVNNSAHIGGNTIHASPIYSCYSITSNKIVKSTKEYLGQFNITNTSNNDLLDISSDPYMMKVCDNKTLGVNHYPGETIHLSMCALDGSGNHVHSIVSVSLANYDIYSNRLKHSNSHILSSDQYQILKESHNKSCSIINITIIHYDNIPSSPKYQEIPVLLSPFSSNDVERVLIRLSNCPIGFILEEGVCQCDYTIGNFSKAKQFITKCDINKLSISLPQYIANTWLGVLKTKSNTSNLGITGDCPFEFCKRMAYFQSFVLINGSYMLANSANLSERVPICFSNREGVLCGSCTESYSVVFGSGDCYKCSNKSLWTILLYTVAGPLLIYLLYSLRLTLTTGTLNGIIFYAQAANVGVLEVLLLYTDHHHALSRFISIFLSFLNLNLGFPLCFYDGMNELWKTGLSLVFPIYLLTIVVILIVLSRYSTWLSNRISHSSVQVLVTVVHLSFSKLLIAIIDVFTPVKIYTSENPHYVWYKNGSIEYGKENGHVLLMAFTLVIVGALLIPYITILIGGRAFLKCSLGDKYLRPIYEAIHGPYREKRKYWFTARLFLLIMMYIIYTAFRGFTILLTNVITGPIIIVFVVIQGHIKPFRNRFVNILDSSVMLNLVMIYVTGSYFFIVPASTKLWIYYDIIVTLVLTVFLSFTLILLYHFLVVTGLLEKVKSKLISKFPRLKQNCVFGIHPRNYRSGLLLSDASGSFYQSCKDFREPVVGF